MPRVPSQVGSTVAPSGGGVVFQSTQGASIDAFGGGAGQALQQAARAGGTLDQLDSMVLRQIAEDNEREAKNLDVQFSSRLRGLLTGDGTEQNPGFLGLKGENALKARDSFRQEVEKARNEVFGRANSKVRELVDPVAATRIGDAEGRVFEHMRTQREVAFKQTSDARIIEAGQKAIAFWNDPAVIVESLGVISSEKIAEGERLGISEEAVQSEIQRAQSVMLSSVIEAATQVDPMQAQKLLLSYSPLMDPDSKVAAATKLKPFIELQQAQEIADATFAKFGADLTKGAAAIRALLSGTAEDKAIEEYKGRVEEVYRVRSEQRSAASAGREAVRYKQEQQSKAEREKATALAVEAARSGKGEEEAIRDLLAAEKPEIAAQAVSIYGGMASKYRAAEKRQLDETVGAFTKTLIDGEGTISLAEAMRSDPTAASVLMNDPFKFQALQGLSNTLQENQGFAKVDDPAIVKALNEMPKNEFVAVDLDLEAGGKITRKTRDTLLKKQQADREELQGLQNKTSTFTSRAMELVKTNLPTRYRATWGKSNAPEAVAALEASVEKQLFTEIQRYIDANGKPPPDQELQLMADRLVMPIYKDQGALLNPFVSTSNLGISGEIATMAPEDLDDVSVEMQYMPEGSPMRLRLLQVLRENKISDQAVMRMGDDWLENVAGAILVQERLPGRLQKLLKEAQ